jgi:murein DD-endopeptidase MepM/ murein hydrolase activator NlpD
MTYYDLGYPVDPLTTNFTQGFGPAKNAWLQDLYVTKLGLLGHNGHDWGTYKKPIVAMHDGKVEVYTTETGGKSIRLWDRKDQMIMTFYCHLNGWKVAPNQTVKKGDVIGISGDTGTMCFGGHLHDGLYELTRNGKKIKNLDNGYKGAIDPAPHLATKFKEGTLIKHQHESKVYLIHNQMKWWLNSEETFKDYMDYPVNKATIEIVDNITLNFYKYGGQIGKSIV